MFEVKYKYIDVSYCEVMHEFGSVEIGDGISYDLVL